MLQPLLDGDVRQLEQGIQDDREGAPSFIALTSTSKALEAYSNDDDDDDIGETVTPFDDDKPNWVCLGLGSSSASTTIRLSAYHSFIVTVSDPSRTR